jgi:hypothetical protein
MAVRIACFWYAVRSKCLESSGPLCNCREVWVNVFARGRNDWLSALFMFCFAIADLVFLRYNFKLDDSGK